MNNMTCTLMFLWYEIEQSVYCDKGYKGPINKTPTEKQFRLA